MHSQKPAGKRKKSAPANMEWKALEIVHPNAAGIDIGGSEHWVAVSPERDASPCGALGVLRRTCVRWRDGWWRRAYAV